MLVNREGGSTPLEDYLGELACVAGHKQAPLPQAQSSTFCSIPACAAGSKTSHAFVLEGLEPKQSSLWKTQMFLLCVHEDTDIVPFNLASHFQFPPAVESFHLVECTQVWSRPRSREGERNE